VYCDVAGDQPRRHGPVDASGEPCNREDGEHRRRIVKHEQRPSPRSLRHHVADGPVASSVVVVVILTGSMAAGSKAAGSMAAGWMIVRVGTQPGSPAACGRLTSCSAFTWC